MSYRQEIGYLLLARPLVSLLKW